MGSLQLIGDSSPVSYKFRGSLSQEYIDEVIDETGVRPPGEFEVSFDLDAVESPDYRRRLRLAHKRYRKVAPYPVLSRPEEEPGPFLEAIEPWLDKVEAEEAKRKAAEELDASEEEARRLHFQEEMKGWVAEHGSERLRLATEGGYRSNTSYALERSKQEMPGFWVDTAGDSTWEERVDPSEEALLLEKSTRAHLEGGESSLKVRIVWLTETPRALDDKMVEQGLGFEAQEALIIEEYLGRYLLVMPLEPELRRQTEDA